MKPSLEWLANPEVFEVNRIPAHSDHSCFTSAVSYTHLNYCICGKAGIAFEKGRYNCL